MKNTKILLFAGLLCLLAVSCKKDEGIMDITLDKFLMGDTKFTSDDDSKVALQFSTNRLLYEVNDVIKVNGETFTLSKSGSGASTVWYANGNSITASKFYCAYADGDGSTLDNYSGNSYHFNLESRLSSATNKILLAGVSENNVLTLRPACAIIRVPLNASYSNVKVGFQTGTVLKAGTMNISDGAVTISGYTYMTGVDDPVNGGLYADFLKMEYNSVEGYWYVAVPVSTTAVTTKLYLYWERGGSPTGYVTSGQVQLNQGYVYTVGSSRQSPFYANGSSKKLFTINEGGDQVRFSAGNLQFAVGEDEEGNRISKWRFAEHQYDVVGSANSSIGRNNKNWIDLFGWGTSGYNSGATAYQPWATSTTYSDYWPGGAYDNHLTGSYSHADWGVNNGEDVVYGNNASGLSDWRTLTNAEWAYLLNNSTNGLATIDGSYYGLVILPDDWSTPVGCPEFTAGTGSGFGTNDYTLEAWDKMENAGAIFLPVTGYRSNTTLYNITAEGWYWSVSYANQGQSYALKINSSSKSVSGKSRQHGCAVRLVRDF